MNAFVRRDLRAALVPWLVARALVGGALGVARYGFGELKGVTRPPALDQGLFAWDAAFYRDIAEHGYGAARAGLRFFPLVPLLARGLGTVLGGNDALALLVIANVSALLFGALLYRLTLSETADPGIATRTVWFAAVLPPALTLVMGYAEATFLVLSAAMFFAFRNRRWWWATPAGFFAGLTRPAAALLAVPAAIEAARGWRTASTGDRLARTSAVLSPLAGTAAYLLWVGREYDDAWLPFRLQSEQRRRGGFADPVSSILDGFGDLFGGDRFGSGLHVLWALAFVALVVVIAHRLPASYTAYAGVTVLFALSAENLDSFERYALSAFPLAIGAAVVTAREDVNRPAVVLAGAGLVAYGVLAFLGRYVP
ncbi:MAG TPA: hypothetical protein VMQ81_04530 [Acidimicrobiia bacterium]|nr:hypothetical protein [Acidimicrobiia bacterium]